MLKTRFRVPLTVCLLVVVAFLASPQLALAVTTLKQVQVSNGTQVDLLFDAKVAKQQLQTEFFNDIIQISLTDTSVYPAKISSVSGSPLLKVFAYQYAPKLVRCRFTVKGKAEDYKDRFQVNLSGKLLTVHIADAEVASDRIGLGAAQAERVVPGSAGDNSPAAKLPANSEESSLMQRVLAANPALSARDAKEVKVLKETKETKEAKEAKDLKDAGPSRAPASEPVHEAVKEAHSVPAEKTSEAPPPVAKTSESEIKLHSKPLGGLKPLPSPLGVLGKLALVLGLFGLLALAVRKFRGGARQETNILNAIGNYAKSGLGRQLGRKEKMIEVLTTHYLGPKKSIAVVRVFGRVLVLAVANESISLITQLPDGNGDAAGAIDDLDLEQLGIPSSPALSGFGNLGGNLGGGSGAAGLNSGGLGATAAGPAVFADLLRQEHGRPGPAVKRSPAGAYANQFAPQAQSSGAARPSDGNGVRAQIRNRLEGLKQL